MKRLTTEQINQLNEIKAAGLYNRDGRYGKSHDHSGKGHRREALFHVLQTGLNMYGATTFKVRYITKQYYQYGKWNNKYARYQDIPLTVGEAINAIKYGLQHHLIQKDGATRTGVWHLIKDINGEDIGEAVRK